MIQSIGVIWDADHILENVHDVLNKLRALGKRILFVSNNSTKSRRDYLTKFTKLGLDATEDEIFSSAYAAAYYIRNTLNFPDDKRVYVCGMGGIQQELDDLDIKHVGGSGSEDDDNLKHINDMSTILPDPTIGAVLFGFDLNINYKKLAKAFTYIHHNPDCHFLATNSDLTFPAKGTGALLAALAAPLHRKPTILGKPEPTMLEVIISKYHLDPKRTCMVGDRLDTDILFGQTGGLKTLLVFSGVTSPAEAAKSHIKADYQMNKLGDMLCVL
ncbi:hypothetical protein HDV05_001678 [Chytridiales sp. JEL 0842]|nr:hypothetical protein HDV05_001678 [Chytridiales sp. JEL 0842]